VLAEDKRDVWKIFLDGFAEDLTPITEDDDMRTKATGKYDFWRKAVK
jgi:hypothetical protein